MVTLGKPLAAIQTCLTLDQQQLLIWTYFDGKPEWQVAEWLKISQQAVSQRLATINRILSRNGMPIPQRPESRRWDHRNVDDCLMRSL
jgi:hypothetical protein